MAATSEQRRAAAVKRLKALPPQERVFRSGVDIDLVHTTHAHLSVSSRGGTSAPRSGLGPLL